MVIDLCLLAVAASKGGDSSYGCCLLTRPYCHDGRNTSKEDTDREMDGA